MSFQKQKGNAFENKVASLLKEITGAKWRRTAYSGAFLGKSNAHRIADLDEDYVTFLKGDIAVPNGYNVVIECKSYASTSFSFSAMISDGFAKLNGWINEAFIDSNKGEIPYFLCFNISRNGDYIALPLSIFTEFVHIHTFDFNGVVYHNPLTKDKYVIFNLKNLSNPVVWDKISKVIKV